MMTQDTESRGSLTADLTALIEATVALVREKLTAEERVDFDAAHRAAVRSKGQGPEAEEYGDLFGRYFDARVSREELKHVSCRGGLTARQIVARYPEVFG